MMGLSQNQSLSLGVSQPEVRDWDPQLQPSSAVNSAIVLLGVLTFALQLCLALYFLVRCWTYDRRVRQTLKHRSSVDKLWTAPPAFPLYKDINKQAGCRLCDDGAAQSVTLQSPAMSGVPGCYDNEDYRLNMVSLSGTFIAWDLVQC